MLDPRPNQHLSPARAHGIADGVGVGELGGRRGTAPEWLEIIGMGDGGMLLARDTADGPPVVERWFMHEPAQLAVAQRLANGIPHAARYRHNVAWVGEFSLAYLPHPVPDPCEETRGGHGHFTRALS